MMMLHSDRPLQGRPFDHAPDFPVIDISDPGFVARMARQAPRAQMTADDYIALIADRWQCRPAVPGAIAEVAALGRRAGAPVLSHDDSQPETCAFYRGMGAAISEFPMNLATARAARAQGDMIVFGAPNAARGGSHLGSPGAAATIAEGLCDVLASDYYYPAMLAARPIARTSPAIETTPWIRAFAGGTGVTKPSCARVNRPA